MEAEQIQPDEGTPRLRYEVENTEPIELIDLTSSLLALGDKYKQFLLKNPGYGRPDDLKLYVREIRTGSVVADLVAWAPLMLAFMEHANSVLDFGDYLAKAYRYLINRPRGREYTLDGRSYKNLSRIVNPIVKDSGAQLNISAGEGANVYITNGASCSEAELGNG